jgi:alkanesulfonate monooxygenase SsuD/methylene tetrahydromethanopterin reductase-like flavin-dependent oxidoreductase (luciferase family)
MFELIQPVESIPRLGLALDAGADADVAATVDALGELCRSAATRGIESVWVGESHPSQAGQGHVASPTLILASLARETRETGLRLGAGVVLAPLWHPLRLAYESSLLDRLTRGQLVLGLGLGPTSVRQRYGVDAFGATEFDDLVIALRRWWAGGDSVTIGSVRYEGSVWPLPIQGGGLPIWIAGRTKASVRRAARLGDAWYAGTPCLFDDLETLGDLYRAEAAASGRAPRVACNRIAVIAASEEEAVRAARDSVERELAYYARIGRLWRPGGAIPDGDLFDEFRDQLLLVGTPEMVRRQLARYAEIGVTDVFLRVMVTGLPLDIAFRSVAQLSQVSSRS